MEVDGGKWQYSRVCVSLCSAWRQKWVVVHLRHHSFGVHLFRVFALNDNIQLVSLVFTCHRDRITTAKKKEPKTRSVTKVYIFCHVDWVVLKTFLLQCFFMCVWFGVVCM